MTARESECEVCEAEIPRKKKVVGQLNLCRECSAEFSDSTIVGCC